MTKVRKAPAKTGGTQVRQGVFRFGTGTKTAYVGGSVNSQPPPSSRASVGVVFLRFMVRNLMSCGTGERVVWRQRIADFLTKVGNPECIDELLSFCTTQGGPDGLDLAIDVLSKTKRVVVEYAWEYLCRDIAKWTPESDRAYNPNDDYWYILLRAVGRTNVDARARFDLIKCCASAESRGIREGVVEGLGDLGTPKAKELLKTFAEHDSDEYIRKIAGETLADLES